MELAWSFGPGYKAIFKTMPSPWGDIKTLFQFDRYKIEDWSISTHEALPQIAFAPAFWDIRISLLSILVGFKFSEDQQTYSNFEAYNTMPDIHF